MSLEADMLMLQGTVQRCPDCDDEQFFLPVDDDHVDSGEFWCTSCGAGLLVDPLLEPSEAAGGESQPSRVA